MPSTLTPRRRRVAVNSPHAEGVLRSTCHSSSRPWRLRPFQKTPRRRRVAVRRTTTCCPRLVTAASSILLPDLPPPPSFHLPLPPPTQQQSRSASAGSGSPLVQGPWRLRPFQKTGRRTAPVQPGGFGRFRRPVAELRRYNLAASAVSEDRLQNCTGRTWRLRPFQKTGCRLAPVALGASAVSATADLAALAVSDAWRLWPFQMPGGFGRFRCLAASAVSEDRSQTCTGSPWRFSRVSNSRPGGFGRFRCLAALAVSDAWRLRPFQMPGGFGRFRRPVADLRRYTSSTLAACCCPALR